MTVAEVIERFARLESQIAEERGDFVLFALFMREDAPDFWDLIVAAPWLGDDTQAAVSYLVDQIKSRLGKQDLIRLSRIVVIDPENVAVQNLNRTIHVEHGNHEVRESTLFGQDIKHAHIITSKRPSAPAAT